MSNVYNLCNDATVMQTISLSFQVLCKSKLVNEKSPINEINIYQLELRRKDSIISCYSQRNNQLHNENLQLREQLKNLRLNKPAAATVIDSFTQTMNTSINVHDDDDDNDDDQNKATITDYYVNRKISSDVYWQIRRLHEKIDYLKQTSSEQKNTISKLVQQKQKLDDNIREANKLFHQRTKLLAQKHQHIMYLKDTCQVLEHDSKNLKRSVRALTNQNRRLRDYIDEQYFNQHQPHVNSSSLSNRSYYYKWYRNDENLQQYHNYKRQYRDYPVYNQNQDQQTANQQTKPLIES